MKGSLVPFPPTPVLGTRFSQASRSSRSASHVGPDLPLHTESPLPPRRREASSKDPPDVLGAGSSDMGETRPVRNSGCWDSAPRPLVRRRRDGGGHGRGAAEGPQQPEPSAGWPQGEGETDLSCHIGP